MWKKTNSSSLYLSDRKIATQDFIVAEGSTLGYSFLDGESKDNPLAKSFWGPVFYTFKVHKNHPLLISHADSSFTYIYPSNEMKKGRRRMPAQVYQNRMDYDISMFMLLPFPNGGLGTAWKQWTIPGGFVDDNGNKKDASLIYLEHGSSLHSQDSLKVSSVMPSYLPRHLGDWMQNGRNIISHVETFEQKLEGRVSVPLEFGRKIFPEMTSLLEKRYGSKLSFRKD